MSIDICFAYHLISAFRIEIEHSIVIENLTNLNSDQWIGLIKNQGQQQNNVIISLKSSLEFLLKNGSLLDIKYCNPPC